MPARWPPSPAVPAGELENTRAIGNVLYTDYIYLFQAAGLDPPGGHDRRHHRLRHKLRISAKACGVQSIAAQTARTRAESVEVKQIPTGSGV